MKKCILHIGVHKTGTSYLQGALCDNKERLYDQGIYVSDVLKPQHGVIARYALPNNDIQFFRRRLGETTPEKIRAWRDAVDKELDSITSDINLSDHTLVLSDEQLSVFHKKPDIDSVYDLISSRFDDIDVVVYIRPQHERLVSGYIENIKTGRDTPLNISQFSNADEAPGYLRYDKVIERWSGVFGKENMKVRIYQREKLLGRDIVRDFLEPYGVDPSDFSKPKTSNDGLSSSAIALMRMMNSKIQRGKGVDKARIQLENGFKKNFPGKPILTTRSETEGFYHLFDDVNESIRAEYFPDSPSLFDVDFSEYPESLSEESISLEEAVDMFSTLWIGKNK